MIIFAEIYDFPAFKIIFEWGKRKERKRDEKRKKQARKRKKGGKIEKEKEKEKEKGIKKWRKREGKGEE